MACAHCDNRTFTLNNERFRLTLVALFATIAIILGVIVGLTNQQSAFDYHGMAGASAGTFEAPYLTS